jgi:outer membrane protein assembly factor BamB
MTAEGDDGRGGRYCRRAVLASVAGLAGCVSLGGGGSSDRSTPAATDEPPTATPTPERTRTPTATAAPTATATATPAVLAAVSGDYPAYRHDAGRRAYTPSTAGPAAAPEVAYTLELPGAVTQPVVADDRLSLAVQGDGEVSPTVATYDLRRGTRLWTADVGAPAGTAPVFVDDRVLVQTPRGTCALDGDGQRVWRSQAVTTGGFDPTVVGDRVYVVGGRAMAALGVDGSRVWSAPLGAQPLAPPAADGDRVYLLVPRDMTTMGLLALDAEDGTTAWRRAVEARSGFPPTRAGDTVYVTSDRRQGGVTALDADSGDRRWRADVRLDRGPAVTDDRIVVARGPRVVGLSRADGSVEWSTDFASDVRTDPVADSETTYVGVDAGDGGLLAAVGTASGTIRYTLSFDRPVDRVVILEEGLAVTTGDSQRLHVLVGR